VLAVMVGSTAFEPTGEDRAFFDVYGAGMQLGALPRHGTAGERALLMLRGFGLRQ